MKNNILAILLLFICTACEKTITNFEVPDKPTKLVVNGLAAADSIISINISKSLSFNDRIEFTPVNNAVLNLTTDDDQNITFSSMGNGWYLSTEFAPNTLSHFNFEVSASDLETVYTQFYIPSKPEILNMSSSVSKRSPDYCLSCEAIYFLDVDITLKDESSNVTNYYMIEAQHNLNIDNYYYTDEYGSPIEPVDTIIETPWIYKSRNLYVSSHSKAIEATAGDYYEVVTPQYGASGKKLILSDTYFQGEEYTIALEINLNEMLYYLTDSIPNQYKVQIALSEIDENYYNYVHNMARIEETLYNPLAEPVTPAQFIENGFGMVYGINTVQDTIDLLEVEPDLENFTPDEEYYYY